MNYFNNGVKILNNGVISLNNGVKSVDSTLDPLLKSYATYAISYTLNRTYWTVKLNFKYQNSIKNS